MALSLVSVLRQSGEVDQDRLARSFSEHYDPQRGYGPAMHDIVPMMWLPGSWVSLSRRLFGGQGSFGNGAAMRVAPLGAFFADDLETAASQAFDSAIVTHAHPEAAAGAVAVAVGAALAWQGRDLRPRPTLPDFLDGILTLVPEGEVRAGIERARDLPPETTVSQAARILGNGDGVSAQDTVPFVLWCAGPAPRQLRRRPVANRQRPGRPRHHLRDGRRHRRPVGRRGQHPRRLDRRPRAAAHLAVRGADADVTTVGKLCPEVHGYWARTPKSTASRY